MFCVCRKRRLSFNQTIKLSGILSELILLETAEKAALEGHLQTLQDGIEARAITQVLADSEPLGVQATNRFDSLINATAHTGKASPRAPIPYRADLLENVEITDTIFSQRRVGISKNGRMRVLAYFTVTLYVTSKSDFQKTLPIELKKSSFIHPKKSVTAGMVHW